MRAIVFGQSGIEKEQYLQLVLDATRAHGREFTILNIGTMMHEGIQGTHTLSLFRLLDSPPSCQ